MFSADAQSQISSFRGCSKEEVDELRKVWADERSKFESYIVELEGKLERELSMRELIKENQLLDYSNDINATIPNHGQQKSKSPLKTSNKNVRYSDNKRIKELEKLVVDLQERLLRATKGAQSTLSDLIIAAKPSIEESSYINHLKDRVKRLENELENKQATWESKIKIFQSEVCSSLMIIAKYIYNTSCSKVIKDKRNLRV